MEGILQGTDEWEKMRERERMEIDGNGVNLEVERISKDEVRET